MRLTLCLILAALTAAFVWLLGHDSTAGAIVDKAPGTQAESEEQSAETPSSKTGALAPEKDRTPSKEPEKRTSVAVPSTDLIGELRVLRFGDDEPIEGAEVGYLVGTPDYQALSKEDLGALQNADIEFYRKYGVIQKTDSAGKCKLPLQSYGLSVIITFEDLYGSAFLDPKKLSTTARLKLEHKLVVHVEDTAGRAAEGVRIVGMRKLKDGPQIYNLGITDAEGQFTQHHTQFYAATDQNQGMSIHAAGIGVKSDSVDVDLLSSREVHATLSMPRSGTITFELVDEAGRPFDQTGYEKPGISVSTHDTNPNRREAFGTINFARHTFGADSRVVVRFLALDKFYAAHMHKLIRRALTGEGPTTNTPDIVVPIVIASDTVVFAGRAVDSSGEPLESKNLYLICKHDRGKAGQTTTTWDKGEFQLPIPSLKPGKTVQLSGLIRRTEKPNLSYRHKAPWTVTKGKNDVGDIVFAVSPVLLSGRIIVPPTLEDRHRMGWQIELMKGQRWTQQYELQTMWPAVRRFEVRGEVPEGARLRLVFQTGKHLPLEPLEFVAGSEDIEIQLATAGSVTATFLLDRLVHQSALSVHLDPEVPPDENDPRQRMARLMGNRYRLQAMGNGKLQATWQGLLSGRYTVRMQCTGSSQPLVAISGILVEGGEVDDPRLKDIDLRGRLRQIEISLIDEQGKAFTQDKTVVYLASAGATEWEGLRPKNGKLKISIVDSVRLCVLSQDHALEWEDAVSADQVIVIKKAPAVRFVVNWPFPLPEGIKPQLRLTPTIPGTTRKTRARIGGSSGGIDNHVLSRGAIDRDGRATIYPIYLGKQRVVIAMDPEGRGHYMYPKAHRSIVVTGEETEVIEIKVSVATLQKSLDRMKK